MTKSKVTHSHFRLLNSFLASAFAAELHQGSIHYFEQICKWWILEHLSRRATNNHLIPLSIDNIYIWIRNIGTPSLIRTMLYLTCNCKKVKYNDLSKRTVDRFLNAVFLISDKLHHISYVSYRKRLLTELVKSLMFSVNCVQFSSDQSKSIVLNIRCLLKNTTFVCQKRNLTSF